MKKMIIDGKTVSFDKERNVLEVIRAAQIDIPTFCYHSELSVYGSCRLCICEIEGRGIQATCSILPEDGMVVKTNTAQIRDMRRIYIELLLASYDHNCPTCAKNSTCKLQEIAQRLGVRNIRFKKSDRILPLDTSSPSIVRDPNKCILCGDCVRACYEIQGIGAIDFTRRGSNVTVQPAFDKDISKVDCVNCGQCARVCPTGAITPKSDIENVWKVLDSPKKKVVVQIAPAVRVAIGESFGLEPGTIQIGQIVSAMRILGFDKIYDTGFSADLTVIEEATEFIERKTSGKNLPQFTSCCPAWVKYIEQYYPELLPNLSTCRSPQQMFGSVAKRILPKELDINVEDLVVVSVMPCTAKKFEASRPEFASQRGRDVDYVITTQELAAMIKEAGIRFTELMPDSLDMPLGFKTGAGIIFGASGGVSEAVLRFAYEKIKGKTLDFVDFSEVRGSEGIRSAEVNINNTNIKIAIVHSLINAKRLIEKIKSGEEYYDIVEVMACPGGCIGGAGQPVYYDEDVKLKRTKGIYSVDKMMQLHKSQENPYISKLYDNTLGEVGGKLAHELLHTSYCKRKRIELDDMTVSGGMEAKIDISVCLGTSCFVRGSQTLLKKIMHYVNDNNLFNLIKVKANFCMENCDNGPSVVINGKLIHKCTYDKIIEEIELRLPLLKAVANDIELQNESN